MPLKTDTIEEPVLNLTPMIDIVFLLIIFFMVGSRFTAQERQVDVKLPRVAAATPLTAGPDEITVNVLTDGNVVINDRTLTLSALEEELVKAKDAYADQAVIIRGPGNDPYQLVMDVLAIANRANISKVSLAYQVQSKGNP